MPQQFQSTSSEETAFIGTSQSPHTSEYATEQSWKTLTVIHEWVRYLDGKATAILAADAAIAAALAALMKNNADYLRNYHFIAGLLGLAAISLITSAVRCLYCITPTLHPHPTPFGKLLNLFSPPYYEAVSFEKTSAIYFNEIPETVPKYRETAEAIFTDPEKLRSQLAEQITANAKVARGKSLDIGRAVQFLIWALIFAALAFVVTLFQK